MDIRNGNILTPEQMQRLAAYAPQSEFQFIKPMELPPTPKQLARKPAPRVGRNEPCPCGSGKKFKKCCLLEA